MQKRKNMVTCQKHSCKLSISSMAMITKQQIRIKYLKQISIKSGAQKTKYYQKPKN